MTSETKKTNGENLKPATCKRCSEKYQPYNEFSPTNKREVAGYCDHCTHIAKKSD